MKTFLTLLLISIGISTAFSQRLSDYHKDLDRLLYSTNKYIQSYSACLCKLEDAVKTNKRINPKGYGFNGCNHETPWDRVLIQEKEFYDLVKASDPEIFEALNQLNTVAKKVVIDIKLERLDEARINGHLKKFPDAAAQLHASTATLREQWRQAALQKLPKALADYLREEFKDFSPIEYQLRKSVTKVFPEELLRKNMENTDSLLVSIEKRASSDPELKRMLYSIGANQKNKEHYLNKLNLSLRASTDNRNDFYYQIHNHFNNSVVSMLRAVYQTPQSIFIPFQPQNNTQADEVPEPVYKFKSVDQKNFDGTVQHWNFKDVDALVDLTDAVNEAVRKTNHSTEAIYKIKSSIERYRERGKGSVSSYHDPKLNLGEVEAALGRLKQNSNEAFPLISEQSRNLLDLLEDRKLIFELIKRELENETWKNDDFAKVEELIQQYEALLPQLDEQLKVLESNMNKANTPKLGGQDNWSKTARALESYCQTLRDEVEWAEDQILDKENDEYPGEAIPKEYEQLLEQQIPMMTGIKKLGDYNGNCPFGTFEDVLDNGIAQHKKALKFKEADTLNVPFKSGCCDGYEGQVRYHNAAIKYYNKFSAQGAQRDSDYAKYYHKTPVVNRLLLYKPLQLPPSTPQKKEPVPVPPTPEEPQIDTTKKKMTPQMTKEYLNQCKPNSILFLIDVSASMKSPYKLDRFKQDLQKLKTVMREEDQIAIVSFDGKSRIVLKPTSILNEKAWMKAFDKLTSSGRTYFNEGLLLAYDYMEKIADPTHNNRIVLISDGEFQIKSESMERVKGAADKIQFSALIYNPHAKIFQSILDLTAQASGNYSLITGEADGAEALFEEFSVLIK